MDINQLKFILKLLDKKDYKAPISQLKPNGKTSLAEVQRICRQLQAIDLIEFTEEIVDIKITASGKSLLKLDVNNLPITNQELKIIEACANKSITPSQTKVTPAKIRDELINQLINKGFIAINNQKIKEVWLTATGQKFLATEYDPSGTGNISISKNLLGIYLKFLRNYLSNLNYHSPSNQIEESGSAIIEQKLNDSEILQTIIDLDRELMTSNYLPIFHLRNKLQPALTREELDQALYRLQEQDKIELSTLNEVHAYTAEEIQAGIPKAIGGRLFFIIVNS